jgi:hypothetical protein
MSFQIWLSDWMRLAKSSAVPCSGMIPCRVSSVELPESSNILRSVVFSTLTISGLVPLAASTPHQFEIS